jgi:hypothetical protein
MKIFNNFGKREALIYIIVALWIIMGIYAAFKASSLSDLGVYFGSLTAYAATYIWAESKRPSTKTGVFKAGPRSRREIMIYFVVLLWAIAGFVSMYFSRDLNDLSIYFASLTGFVASWIAGERFKPEDHIIKDLKTKDEYENIENIEE